MVSKLILFTLVVFLVILILFLNNRSMSAKSYTYLALGDSYTIGENVALHESYPYQTIQLLRKAGHNFNAAEILAKTGWTTDDLKKGIRNTMFQSSYDFVSLLIGVNDQYNGGIVSDYAKNFEHLLQQAISFAGNNPARVVVLSIPDWGRTPFAARKDRAEITGQINLLNLENQKISRKYMVNYIQLGQSLKEEIIDDSLLASDQLHYSGKVYAGWAQQMLEVIQRRFI